MATDAARPHRNRVVPPNPTAGSPSTPAKRRRWWLWGTLATLAVIVWLLPGIVVHTPLLHWILGKATADLNGSVTVDSASLGWLSPVAVEGVEVKDAKGEPCCRCRAWPAIGRWLAIVCNYTNLGQFTLDGPKLSLVLRDDGSNLEDLLAKYLAPKKNLHRP